MIQQETPEKNALRQRLGAALLNVRSEDVIAVAEAIAERYQVRHKRMPKSGLGMMRFRESVMAQAFNLGEVPMSSAHIELVDTSGHVHEGGSVILRDHEVLAIAIAVCDAVLAGGLDEDGAVQQLVDEGLKVTSEDAKLRRAMLERSRVSFALMNQDDLEGVDEDHD